MLSKEEGIITRTTRQEVDTARRFSWSTHQFEAIAYLLVIARAELSSVRV